jgi:hypothetical protein
MESSSYPSSNSCAARAAIGHCPITGSNWRQNIIIGNSSRSARTSHAFYLSKPAEVD